MPQYSNNIAITFPGGSPLVGCANNARATSNPIDNSVVRFDVVDIQVKFMLAASGVLSSGNVAIAILGSDDGGVTYETSLQSGNIIETVQGLVDSGSFVVRATVTNVPEFWKLAVRNRSGAAFNSTALNFESVYAGVINSNQLGIITGQVNVTTSATLLAAASLNRQNLIVSNHGSDTIFLGGSGVTISTGYALGAGGSIQLPSFSGNALYGIVPSVTSLADVMEY